MNLPGVDTYVCDASATKDADARALPNLPPATWPQKVAYCAPTGGRSGSALCPLWEGAADIAGEGWTAAFDPQPT